LKDDAGNSRHGSADQVSVVCDRYLCSQINARGGLFGCINVDEQRFEVHRGSLFNLLR
jgi:hypothetical protein